MTLFGPRNLLQSVSALETHDLPDCWQIVLSTQDAQSQLAQIRTKLQADLDRGEQIFPSDPWYALRKTPLQQTRVVILGQDPYHGPDQAHGLAFSVQDTVAPPSLRNILKEITRSHPHIDEPVISHDLSHWAQQGVLLLNATLTVAQGRAASHAEYGWQTLTDYLIAATAQQPVPIVYLLWGRHAQSKRTLIEQTTQAQGLPATSRLILDANHPSPLSANRPPHPFIGCNHFVLSNHWLQAQAQKTIDWFATPS
ncbi:uracil-DNA glycosylase [Orrella sp. 11846]|uniref:uracil-DNA glycosylase n=1 Tax=Orrella sp. 11846 TaxID=3409913 RepID=UPI003B5CB487